MDLPPFAKCEEIIFSKEKGKCAISKKPIKKGESVFAFKFIDFNDVPIEYAKKEVFLNTKEYANDYLHKFLPRKYEVNDFLEKSGYYSFYHPGIKKAIGDIQKVMKVIANPPLIPRPYHYRSDLDKQGLRLPPSIDHQENRESTSHQELMNLIAIYLNCGYANYFLDHLEELPIPSWFLLAMSDDLRFQEKVEKKFNFKLSEIFAILGKSRLTLEDMLQITSIIKDRKDVLVYLEKFINLYQPHLTGVIPAHGFTRFGNLHNGQLCYLFINEPSYHPLLKKCIDTGEFPIDSYGTFTYIQCFYQRARIIHHLLKKEFDTAISIAGNLETYVQYYVSGSPRGFINDTRKMAVKFIKQNK